MSIQDVEERKYWDDYMKAYHQMLEATHTENSPWYVIPADDKKNARLIVCQLMLNQMQKLHMDYPTVSEAFLQEMKEAKALLEAEK